MYTFKEFIFWDNPTMILGNLTDNTYTLCINCKKNYRLSTIDKLIEKAEEKINVLNKL